MNPNNKPYRLPVRGQVHKWIADRGLKDYKLEGMPTRFCEEMVIYYTSSTNNEGMKLLAEDLEFTYGYPVVNLPVCPETGKGGILKIFPKEASDADNY